MADLLDEDEIGPQSVRGYIERNSIAREPPVGASWLVTPLAPLCTSLPSHPGPARSSENLCSADDQDVPGECALLLQQETRSNPLRLLPPLRLVKSLSRE
jgi:hypothetical protein